MWVTKCEGNGQYWSEDGCIDVKFYHTSRKQVHLNVHHDQKSIYYLPLFVTNFYSHIECSQISVNFLFDIDLTVPQRFRWTEGQLF